MIGQQITVGQFFSKMIFNMTIMYFIPQTGIAFYARDILMMLHQEIKFLIYGYHFW